MKKILLIIFFMISIFAFSNNLILENNSNIYLGTILDANVDNKQNINLFFGGNYNIKNFNLGTNIDYHLRLNKEDKVILNLKVGYFDNVHTLNGMIGIGFINKEKNYLDFNSIIEYMNTIKVENMNISFLILNNFYYSKEEFIKNSILTAFQVGIIKNEKEVYLRPYIKYILNFKEKINDNNFFELGYGLEVGYEKKYENIVLSQKLDIDNKLNINIGMSLGYNL